LVLARIPTVIFCKNSWRNFYTDTIIKIAATLHIFLVRISKMKEVSIRIFLFRHWQKQMFIFAQNVRESFTPYSKFRVTAIFKRFPGEKHELITIFHDFPAKHKQKCSVADLDPGSSAFLTQDPGSVTGFFRIPDLGTKAHIFDGFDKFLGKKYYNSERFG
jgi:hypothetical protein